MTPGHRPFPPGPAAVPALASLRGPHADVCAAIRAAVEVALAQGAGACAALVGSWASGRARIGSDVDLIEDTELLLTSDAWFDAFGPGATVVRRGDFGALQGAASSPA